MTLKKIVQQTKIEELVDIMLSDEEREKNTIQHRDSNFGKIFTVILKRINSESRIDSLLSKFCSCCLFNKS